MFLHSQVRCLGATLHHPAIICARNRTNRNLEEGQAFAESDVTYGENDVRMAIDVFRETMEDDISTLK